VARLRGPGASVLKAAEGASEVAGNAPQAAGGSFQAAPTVLPAVESALRV